MTEKRFGRTVLLAASIALLSSIAIHAYVGSFSRYIADDYCTAASLADRGLIGSQVYWYRHWSGRFAFTLTVNLLEALGPAAVPFLTAAVLAGWLIALQAVVRRLLTRFGYEDPVFLSLMLSLLFLSLLLAGMPDPFQSLYWQTGSLTYTFPLVLLTVQALMISRAAGDQTAGRVWYSRVGMALLAMWTAGYSETIAVVQLVWYAGLASASFSGNSSQNRGELWRLASAWIGSALGLLLVIVAPGNAVRLGLMPERVGWFGLIRQTLQDAYVYTRMSASTMPSQNALALIVPALAVWIWPPCEEVSGVLLRRWWMVPLLMLALLLAVIGPSEYATGSYPAGRVIVTIEAVRIAGLAALGLLFGLWARGWRLGRPGSAAARVLAGAALVSACGWVAWRSFQPAMEWLPKVRQFADLWDTRDEEMRLAAASSNDGLAVRSLPHLSGLAEVEDDPEEWINRCIAQYYGLGSVRAK